VKDRTDKWREIKASAFADCPTPIEAFVLVAIGEDGQLWWGANYPTDVATRGKMAEERDIRMHWLIDERTRGISFRGLSELPRAVMIIKENDLLIKNLLQIIREVDNLHEGLADTRLAEHSYRIEKILVEGK
jgi:hypothetical protein